MVSGPYRVVQTLSVFSVVPHTKIQTLWTVVCRACAGFLHGGAIKENSAFNTHFKAILGLFLAIFDILEGAIRPLAPPGYALVVCNLALARVAYCSVYFTRIIAIFSFMITFAGRCLSSKMGVVSCLQCVRCCLTLIIYDI